MRLKSNPYPFEDVIKLNNDIDQTFARPSRSTGAASSGREGTTMNPGGDVDDFSNGTLLARTLAVMPNVKKIHIKFGVYPFQDLSLASQWNRMEKMDGLVEARSTIQDQPLAVRSYSSILMGANAAALPFTSLQMDSMPVRCFVPPDEKHVASPLNHLATMRNAVRYVQKLDAKFSGCFLDYTHPESLTIPHNLALFLGSMPLQSLDLRWGDSFHDWGHLDSIDNNTETPLPVFAILRSYLPTCHYTPNLPYGTSYAYDTNLISIFDQTFNAQKVAHQQYRETMFQQRLLSDRSSLCLETDPL